MLNNLKTLSTSRAIQTIVDAAQVQALGFDESYTGLPIVLYGTAGCGKTYAGKAAAKQLDCQYVEVPVMHYSPTDITGSKTIPLDGSDFIKHYLPDWTRDLDKDEAAVINLDEVTKGPNLTVASLLAVLAERRAGLYELGRAWTFILTGNTAESRAGDRELASPTRTRAAQFLVKNTTTEFLNNFAVPNNLHWLVTSFLEHNKDNPDFTDGVLNTWDSESNPAAFGCERSWTMLAKVLSSGVDHRDLSYGIVGNELAAIFNTHVELQDKLPDIAEVFSNPEGAGMPEDMIVCHYAGNLVSYYAEPGKMQAICTYFSRMPSEIATTSMHEVIRRHPECQNTQAYARFRTQYNLSSV